MTEDERDAEDLSHCPDVESFIDAYTAKVEAKEAISQIEEELPSFTHRIVVEEVSPPRSALSHQRLQYDALLAAIAEHTSGADFLAILQCASETVDRVLSEE